MAAIHDYTPKTDFVVLLANAQRGLPSGAEINAVGDVSGTEWEQSMAFQNENPYQVDETVGAQELSPGAEKTDAPSGRLTLEQHFGITLACSVVSLCVFFATLFAASVISNWIVVPYFGRDNGLGYVVEVASSVLATVVAFIEMQRRLVRTLKREG